MRYDCRTIYIYIHVYDKYGFQTTCIRFKFQNATDRAVLVNIVNIISELLGKTRK